jgi:hypothetical protein
MDELDTLLEDAQGVAGCMRYTIAEDVEQKSYVKRSTPWHILMLVDSMDREPYRKISGILPMVVRIVRDHPLKRNAITLARALVEFRQSRIKKNLTRMIAT